MQSAIIWFGKKRELTLASLKSFLIDQGCTVEDAEWRLEPTGCPAEKHDEMLAFIETHAI